MPVFTDKDPVRLSRSSPEDTKHVTFATCGNDVNSRCIQGLIKTHKTQCITLMLTPIGEAIFSQITTNEDAANVLTGIQLSPEVFEFGVSKCNCQGVRSDIEALKRSADSGMSSLILPKETHPGICRKCPGLVHGCSATTANMNCCWNQLTAPTNDRASQSSPIAKAPQTNE